MKKYISIILTVIAIGCCIAAGGLIFRGWQEDKQAEAALEELRAAAGESFSPKTTDPSHTDATSSPTDNAEASTLTSDDSIVASSSTADITEEPTETTNPQPEAIANPYADSFLANDDMAGWLKIPDTEIDYPIMWTPEDETYYLYRDFNGNENKNGCLLLDTDSCLSPLTTNLIIHGHNMKSGAMFGTLTDYENQSFYENHKQITLYTEECQRNYEVIAVFRSQVYKKSQDVFKFYKFFQADTEEEFNDFYQNIKELSIYDTGVTAEFGDHFITLSTCVYHVEQGRFVVVAKEVESGDTYLPVSEEY